MLSSGKAVFIEFKRIGTPSQVKIAPEQLAHLLQAD